MSGSARTPAAVQRNALAPGLLAALALLVGLLLLDNDWFTVVRYVVAILALIVAWFAVPARQWWWTVAFLGVAVIWNPVYPLPFSGTWWVAAQVLAAGAFLLAGLLITTKRA